MRGSQWFAQLTKEEVPTQKCTSRGRSKVLIKQRNACMFARFYIYSQFKLRFDLIIKLVARDFFISEVSAKEILIDNSDDYTNFKKEQPTSKEFEKVWPQMNWNLDINDIIKN